MTFKDWMIKEKGWPPEFLNIMQQTCELAEEYAQLKARKAAEYIWNNYPTEIDGKNKVINEAVQHATGVNNVSHSS